MISPLIWERFPDTLTIITTYRCNAECAQCCFESNPRIKGRLELSYMREIISDAAHSFPSLRLIVFSGGESFLLKDDLYAAIEHTSSLGLMSRVVTNGFWGKSKATAKRTAEKLWDAGISEVNISTGADHQKWVPFDSVVSAATALVTKGIRTLITVEADGDSTRCVNQANTDPRLNDLVTNHSDIFGIQTNIWMPFNSEYDPSRAAEGGGVYAGCEQLYSNMVVTPHKRLSSCCGLTFEYIPEMKLGSVEPGNLRVLAEKQLDDFVKIWLAVEGPGTIIKRLFPESYRDIIGGAGHICHACVILYKNEQIRREIINRAAEFAPEILAKFNLRITLNHISRGVHKETCDSLLESVID